jgi:hypothetical protein
MCAREGHMSEDVTCLVMKGRLNAAETSVGKKQALSHMLRVLL